MLCCSGEHYRAILALLLNLCIKVTFLQKKKGQIASMALEELSFGSVNVRTDG